MNDLELAAFRAIEHTSWDVDHAISKNSIFYNQALLRLQNTIQQMNVLRYFANDDKSLPAGLTYQSLMEMVGREPVRVHTVMQANASQFLIQWITDFVMQPVAFANAVAKTFPFWNAELRMFARMTFPAIFQHFLTTEYQNLAVSFLEEYIKIAPSRNSGEFFCTFMRSNFLYFEMLWNCFSTMMGKHGTILKSTMSFGILLKALKSASVSLTEANLRVMKIFEAANPKDFAFILIEKFLKQSFIEAHSYKVGDINDEQIISQLNFAAHNPNSPHFQMIYDAMKPTVGTRWVPEQADFSPNLGRVNVLISTQDACLVERIAMENTEMSNLKFTQSFALPECIHHVYRPIYYEFSMKPFISKEATIGMRLFGCDKEFELDASQEYRGHWKTLESVSGQLNTTPLEILRTRYINGPAFGATDTPQLYEYGLKVMYNRAVAKKERYEQFIKLLASKDNIDRMQSLVTKELDITLQRFTSLMFRSFKTYESFTNTKSTSATSTNIAPCMAVHRYAQQFRIQNDNEIKDLMDIMSHGEKQNERLAFLNKMERRVSHSENMINLGKNARRRRTSFEATQRQSSHYKSILSEILPECGKSSLCMWIYFKSIDDCHRDDRSISQLKVQYRELVNVEKLIHPNAVHQWKHVLPYIKKCMKRSDLVNMQRSVSMVVLAEIGTELMQIHEKFFKPLSTETAALSSAKMMKLVICQCDDSIFEAFLWCEKFFFVFPDLKAMLPRYISVPLSFVRTAMWVIIRELDEELVTKITEFRQCPF